MKHHHAVFAITFVFLFSTAFAATLPTILIEKVDPQPVEPGRDFTIDITLFNKETSDTGNFKSEIEHQFPFIFKSSTEDFSSVNVCGGCSKKNKYFLSIEPTAVSGTYPLFIKESTGDTVVRQRVDIKVQGRSNLIFSTNSVLDNLTPNAKFAAVLSVTNIGSGQARQIKLQPESANFNVLGGSVKAIDTINASESRDVTFEFVASSNLEANSYSIPFRIIYLDEQGSTVNSSQSLGVRIVNKGDINVQAVKVVANTGSPRISVGEPFTVVARLENSGYGDADAVSAEVECPFAPTKKAFVGQLKKDEDAPAVIEMSSSKAGTFTCNMLVFYKDDTGSYQFSDAFDVTVASPNYAGTIIFLLVILAVLALIFRKRIPFFKKK